MTKFWEDDMPIFFADFGVEASLGRIATIGIGAGGLGYAVNDVLTLATPTGGIAATVKVTHVTAGDVDGVSLLTAGRGYTTGLKATTVSPAGGAACTINVLTLYSIDVIFHNEYEAMILFAGEIESRNPYVEVQDSDIVGIAHASTLVIGGVTYKVTAIKPDGTGITVLELSKD